MTTYTIFLNGEKPMPLIKAEMDRLKQSSPDHPLLKSKGYELVPIPKTDRENYIRDFLSTKADPNKMYLGIWELGIMQTRHVNEERMTGRCHVNETKHSGARKWETKYVLYHVNKDEGRIKEFDAYAMKGDAMSQAKDYAIKNDCEVEVRLEKRLIGSKPHVASISPIKKWVKEDVTEQTNIFVIFGRDE